MNLGETLVAYVDNLWQVVQEAAPWLLVGLVAAGLIKALIPPDWMSRWLGRRGMGSIVRAAVIGTPLPLCSCGVLPAAMGLRRAGASKGATVSFLVATPENGVDSIAVSYALLGPFMMIVRPIAGLTSAILAGIMAEIGAGTDAKPQAAEPPSCCSAKKSCCEKPAETLAPPREPLVRRVREGLRYAMTRVVDDMIVWLSIGLLGAAAITTFVPESFLREYGSGTLGLFVMLLVGLPMYICAVASTPVAAALIAGGVSPGAALVFLLAGPATNLGTIMVVKRELGTGATIGYVGGVCVGALAFGFAVNALAGSMQLDVAAQAGHVHEMLPRWLSIASAVLLIVLGIRPLRSLLIRPTGESRLGAAPVTHAGH